MARDEVYRKAEEMIEEARQSGATELSLQGEYESGSPKLTELPESLSQLTQLQALHLNNNRLTTLPEWLSQLTQLKLLGIGDNQLTALPEWLSQLSHLETLVINSNPLKILPGWLGKFVRMRHLAVGGLGLTELPDSFGELQQLTNLYIWGNPIKRLPQWLYKLSRLKTLNLHSIEISGISEQIGDLQNLSYLHIYDNLLTDLPVSLARLQHLKELRLEDNPLNPELAAAYKEGLDAVKRYLRAKAGAQIVLNEAKLILVGEGEVGKSCLLGAMRGDQWEEGRPTTHGIEIKSVKVIDPESGTEITLNGWDFGGSACTGRRTSCSSARRRFTWWCGSRGRGRSRVS